MIASIGITFAENSSLCGIGVGINKNSDIGDVIIALVAENSPAQKAGIQVGDKIIKINSEDTLSMPLQVAQEKIKGAQGTSVKLLVQRDGTQKTYTLKRDYFKVPIAMYAPRWGEFCPTKYVNAQYIAADTGLDVQKNFLVTKRQQFLDRSIIGRPFVVHNLRKRVQAQRVANYWAQRRMIFDNEIKTCSADENNASNCFMQVRQLENARNVQLQNQRIAEIQISQQDQNNALNFFNFLQMQQVNSNLNGINNNLRDINHGLDILNTPSGYYTPIRY